MMKLAFVILLFTFASAKIILSEITHDFGSRVDLGSGRLVDGKMIGLREGLNADGNLLISLFNVEILYLETIL